MTEKHGRFLRIEQRRADPRPGEDREPEAADRARIAAVVDAAARSRPLEEEIETAADGPEAGVPAREPLSAEAALEDAPGAAGLELSLDTAPVEGQPFVRCARCGADSAMHAARCDNCAAPLDTAEQRAFNDRVWETQRERAAREREALEEMRRFREEARRAAVREIPGSSMGLPPELMKPVEVDDGPYLLELVGSLRERRWRWAAGAAIVGSPLLLAAAGGPILSKLGWVMAVLFVLGMFPKSVGRRVLSFLAGLRSPR